MAITKPINLDHCTHLRVTSFPLADANGNITEYVNTNGTVVAHYQYDAFGNTSASSGAMADDFHFLFSSKYLDEETGFYYYGYRYYHPASGRWLSRDPIGEWGGLMLYGFVNNSVVNIIDILGLQSSDPCCKDGELIDCKELNDKIRKLFDIYIDLSDAHINALEFQYDSLWDLFWIDRAVDMSTSVLGAGVGKLVRSVQLGLASKPILHGTKLGVDMVRSGVLTGPGLCALADYRVVGGTAAAAAANFGLKKANKMHSKKRKRGTERVRQANDDAAESLMDAADRVNKVLKEQRDIYRKCCM